MALSEIDWDQDVPLPRLGRIQAKVTVGLVALLCFINSYDGEFVFDDSEAIINNKDLKPATPLTNIWSNDFWGSNLSSNSSHKSYRPLTVFTFRLNYMLAGGLHPVGFHVLNIALHAIISAMMIDVFALLIGGLAYDKSARVLNRAPKTSLLAALFFAAHPVHTESVAGVVGRADLLCALFFQLSFLTYCKAFKRVGDNGGFSVWWIMVSLSLCATAMLCKEQGITVLGVNAAFDVLLICNVDVYELSQRLLLRKTPLNAREKLLTGLPLRLALMALGGFLMLYTRWRIMGTGPPAFTEVDNPASFAENMFLRNVLRISILALIVTYIARCAVRSHQWRSEQSLFTSALAVCPLNAKVHYNVGKNLADRGNATAAISYYREAVRLHPTYVHAMNNLGNILKERNELVEAEQLLSKAVSIQPDFAAAWMNLGIVQNSLSKFELAERSYWNAIHFRRKYPDCYYNLGRLYADQQRHLDALNAWRNATVLKPDHSLAWNNMVILLDNIGNLGQAELIGREALKLLPNDHTIMFSLANVLGKQEKYKESEGFFLHALQINPKAAGCHGNLAVLYHRWGKLELAQKHYELSLKLDPEAPGTRDNYNMLRRKLDQRKRHAP
ncbi:protein O-mannosyl-transferase TMTC4 isoform X3 [Corythoichthys intestinalis]|uniref:protein O-mannosyl-transferase TMTC4 isoform X3 n=1 Tax=Corythoichthys intestinalis TaxID=161448 RepID=UPI0025A4F283|nr:protein O-mannosyl-transferase TMTC4 isoform X3 [Corythoichthys intestinalis]